MPRISKVRELNLEKEVIDLRQRGFGPVTIARKLNEKYNLQGPSTLGFNNILNFLNSVPKDMMLALKEEHVNEIILEPLRQLKQDLSELRGPLHDKAKAILSKPENILTNLEINSLEIYLKHYEDVWDRIAKIENILKPQENIKAEKVLIIQQYNEIKELVSEVVGSCPNCRQKLVDKLSVTIDGNAEMQ